jgi:hypothetical protein
VTTNPACLSPSTLSPNLQSLGPDCDSGAQFALQDPEMASVKLEDCSQTLELNVIIKDEEEEEKIGKSVSHGKRRFCYLFQLPTVYEKLQYNCFMMNCFNEKVDVISCY